MLCNGTGNQDSKSTLSMPPPKRWPVWGGARPLPARFERYARPARSAHRAGPAHRGRPSLLRHSRPAHHPATLGSPALPSPSTSPAHHRCSRAHFPGAGWHWARPRHRWLWGTVLVGGVGGHGEPPRPAPGGWWDAGGAEGGREANLAALGEGSLQPR